LPESHAQAVLTFNVEATLLSLYRCSKTKKRPEIPLT
jgi:hypothetical protein